MTLEHPKRIPELRTLIQKYELFHDTKGKEPEQCILSLFMLWEYQKGEESFWWPYLDLLPEFEQMIWELDKNLYIKQSQCLIFYDYAREFAADGQDIFGQFKKVVDENTPKIFKKNIFSKSIFNKLYGSVITRCFGYGVPYTCMVPMGDTQNHSDKEANSYEMVNTKQHLRPDLLDKSIPNNTYFSREKYLNNYEPIFSQQDLQYYGDTIRGGAFNREAYLTNEERRTLSYQREQLSKVHTNVWEVPFRDIDIDEDNDTDSEVSDEDVIQRKAGIHSSPGIESAIKTADDIGVLQKPLMDLDHYIEVDQRFEGLDSDDDQHKEGGGKDDGDQIRDKEGAKSVSDADDGGPQQTPTTAKAEEEKRVDPIAQVVQRNAANKNGAKTTPAQDAGEISSEDEFENFNWFKASRQTQMKQEPNSYIAFYNDI